MKQAAVISLILLLVVSLGTSGYLLMNQKKVRAEFEKAKENAENDAQIAKSKEREFELKWRTAASEGQVKLAENHELKAKYSAGVDQFQVQIYQANSAAQMAQAAAAKANSDLQAAQQVASQVPVLKGQVAELAALAKQAEDKSEELVRVQKALKSYTKLGLTPEKIIVILDQRPIVLNSPAILSYKPKAPEKLQKPLLIPSPTGQRP